MKFHTYSDGGARGNPGPSAIGAVLCDEKDKIIEEAAEFIGIGTNNVAEYRAMLKALELAKKAGATELLCSADSQLLIFQMTGQYRIKHPAMQELAALVKKSILDFKKVTWRHVPRENPIVTRADKILNDVLDRTPR